MNTKGAPRREAGKGQIGRSEQLARIAAELDDLRTRTEAAYEALHANLDAQIASLREEVKSLEAEVDRAGARTQARISSQIDELHHQIAALQVELSAVDAEMAASSNKVQERIASQIDALKAKGDAAYDIMLASMRADLNATETEIKRLEALAAASSEETRASIVATIAELQAHRDVAW